MLCMLRMVCFINKVKTIKFENVCLLNSYFQCDYSASCSTFQ